jgi:hypothetical protein
MTKSPGPEGHGLFLLQSRPDDHAADSSSPPEAALRAVPHHHRRRTFYDVRHPENLAVTGNGRIIAVAWLLSARVGEQMLKLLVNPKRPNRHEPRVIKDLQDTYRKMGRPRSYLRRHPELTKR